MKRNLHLCSFFEEPTGEKECLEAIWSVGRACKSCEHACYRRGWDKRQVDVDNKRLVKAKRLEEE